MPAAVLAAGGDRDGERWAGSEDRLQTPAAVLGGAKGTNCRSQQWLRQWPTLGGARAQPDSLRVAYGPKQSAIGVKTQMHLPLLSMLSLDLCIGMYM